METSLDNEMVYDEKALKMMAKMGYTMGTGLGLNRDGQVDPVTLQQNLGKRGLGLEIPDFEPTDETWDHSRETINVEEKVDWISSKCSERCHKDFTSWIKRGPPKLFIDDETRYCDAELLRKILRAKATFDELDATELYQARSRSNPFELVNKVFFMNRAALKMANIDAATDFIFTEIDRNPHHHKRKGPYYFADVCAGPGGFSEYILWRKKWMFKGLGFTLKCDHDFKLTASNCISAVTFNAHYGARGDGDVCYPENIRHFADTVLRETDGRGVHFMTSDGGFSVKGNENLQEILSKQLYTCQCLVALEIVRPYGHFVTKMFDLFTPFSVGLIFLMYHCFEKVAILKPNTSRPANSERFFLCYGLKVGTEVDSVRKYLRAVVCELLKMRQAPNGFNLDINEIVPDSVIKTDRIFSDYIIDSNNRIGANQVVGLQKLTTFCKNPTLIEPRQDELRLEALKYWRIPDKQKIPFRPFTTDDLLRLTVHKPDFLHVPPKYIDDCKRLSKIVLTNFNSWHYVLSSYNRKSNICALYAGVGGSRVYRLQGHKWIHMKKISLIQGTLLYGEMIKEKVLCSNKNSQKQSLHVIDALRLGDTSLADLPFNERLDLIDTYCQAINHESRSKCIRVRLRTAYPLASINLIKTFIVRQLHDDSHHTALPTLGFNSIKEFYDVKSIILLRTDKDFSFRSTYTSRIQIFIKEDGAAADQDGGITLNSLIELLTTKHDFNF